MFFLICLRRELQRRALQAIFTALAMAVGAGLVITVSAVTSDLSNAQASAFRTLYGLDTDVTDLTAITSWQPDCGADGTCAAEDPVARPLVLLTDRSQGCGKGPVPRSDQAMTTS